MIRAVLFDLDGVLVESYEAWYHLLAASTVELGYPAITRERFHASWGQGIQADIDNIFTRHTVAEIERHYAEVFPRHASHMKVDPEGAAVFASLHASGVRTAVVTNTPSPIARKILQSAGLAPQVLVGGTDVPKGKPAPDMVQRACELLVVGPSEAVMVGDSRFDREAAAAAGVPFIGFRLDHPVRIDRLRDLPPKVQELLIR